MLFKVKSLQHSEANLKPLKKLSIEDLSGPFLLSFSLSVMGGILGLQTAGSYGFLSSALLLQLEKMLISSMFDVSWFGGATVKQFNYILNTGLQYEI